MLPNFRAITPFPARLERSSSGRCGERGEPKTNSFTTSGLFVALEVATEFGALAFTQRMLAFEVAWTRALDGCGGASERDAAVALGVIQRLFALNLGEGRDRNSLAVPALVLVLRQGSAEGAAQAAQTDATGQDTIDTAMMPTSFAVLERFKTRMSRLLNLIEELLTHPGDNSLMVRNRLQAALPATVVLRV